MDLRNRFTQRVRDVIALAAQEAERLRHAAVDSEHILLALIRHGGGVAANTLQNLGLSPGKIGMRIDRSMVQGTVTLPANMLRHTPVVETVIELAIDEAHNLGHDYVGTGHLLLGLLREERGLAAEVLREFGLSLDAARREVSRLISRQVAPGGKEQFVWTGVPPLTDADREFFLGLYRSSVAFYKPRIEKRTGVALGDIAVWDYSQLYTDRFEELKRQVPWQLNIFKWLAVRRRLRALWHNNATAYADNARNCAASYFNSAIYVSFSSNTAHEHAMAITTVHELSHALWERLEGQPFHAKSPGTEQLTPTDFETFRLLVEGYAAYAERTWFLDLYPIGARDVLPHARLDRASIHYQGLCKIREMVGQYGAGVLLEIPKRWREFSP